MEKDKHLEKDISLNAIFNPAVSKEEKEDVLQLYKELRELILKYKSKRRLLEIRLKTNDDPRKHDFYAIIAQLTLLDILIAELEHLNRFSETHSLE